MQEELLQLLGNNHIACLQQLKTYDKRVDLAGMNAHAMAVEAL